MKFPLSFTSCRPCPERESPLPAGRLAGTGLRVFVPGTVNEHARGEPAVQAVCLGQLGLRFLKLFFQFPDSLLHAAYAGFLRLFGNVRFGQGAPFLKGIAFASDQPAVGKTEPVMELFQILRARPLALRPFFPLAGGNLQKFAKAARGRLVSD